MQFFKVCEGLTFESVVTEASKEMSLSELQESFFYFIKKIRFEDSTLYDFISKTRGLKDIKGNHEDFKNDKCKAYWICTIYEKEQLSEDVDIKKYTALWDKAFSKINKISDEYEFGWLKKNIQSEDEFVHVFITKKGDASKVDFDTFEKYL